MKKIIILILIIIVILTTAIFVWKNRFKEQPIAADSFESCVSLHYPVLESYPRQCKAPNGTFIEDIGNELKKQDLIKISQPRPNDLVVNPLKVIGEARGYWYFEASFPVKIFDANNNLLGQGIAQAKSDWMTENFVPFEATIEFQEPTTQKGILVLQKDNPSGLPEHDDELRIPIYFNK